MSSRVGCLSPGLNCLKLRGRRNAEPRALETAPANAYRKQSRFSIDHLPFTAIPEVALSPMNILKSLANPRRSHSAPKHKGNALHQLAMGSLCCLVLFATTGCQNPAYKLVPEKKAVQPVAIGQVQADTSLSSVLQTVIIYHGPGSWKREALWDQYVVELTNIGSNALEITGFILIDYEGTELTVGLEPWALEDASREREKYFSVHLSQFQRGALGGTLTVGLMVGGATAYAIVGAAGSAVGGSAIIGASGLAIVVVAPAFFGYTMYKDHSNRKKVEAIFEALSFDYPVSIAPQETLGGSLFFPIAPSPLELVINYTLDGTQHQLHIDLSLLKGLHMNPDTEAKTSE